MYETFPIVEVARKCGLLLNEKTLEREEVEASCPFCGDRGPGKFHLFLNTAKDTYYCQNCKTRGNSVTLYAQMAPGGAMTNQEARARLREEDNVYPMPRRPASPKLPEEPYKPLPIRHDCYYDMLQSLVLLPRHRDDLLRRGLPPERIERNMYRSMPERERDRRLVAQMLLDFHDLTGIPGFGMDRTNWTMTGSRGLLVPVCTKEGYIQGLQIRKDDEDRPARKYQWFAGGKHPVTPSTKNWIHVVGDIHAETGYLTEGGLKGDVASALSGDRLFICVAGVNSLQFLRRTLLGLELKHLVLVMDMDKVYKPNVQAAIKEISGIVRSIPGLTLEMQDWDPGIKGVDDLFLACKQGFRQREYAPTSISKYLAQRWTEQRPKQSAKFIDLCQWRERILPLERLKGPNPTRDDLPLVAREAELISAGRAREEPLVCINHDVADGLIQFWAYSQLGREEVRVIENVPWREAA